MKRLNQISIDSGVDISALGVKELGLLPENTVAQHINQRWLNVSCLPLISVPRMRYTAYFILVSSSLEVKHCVVNMINIFFNFLIAF